MHKPLLLLVAFLSGAILMALEIVGSRVLAPNFGGSIFVWGSLIGVFLAALSVGYYLGGKAVDRYPHAGLMALFLLFSGLFLLLLPHFGAQVCDAIAARDFGPRGNPLLACLALFFLPGVLMGATSPFVIRLTASRVEHVGNTAGVVYAISTLGSIAGTLGMSFYLLTVIGTRASLYCLGAALILTSFLAALVRRPRLVAVAAALLALCSITPQLYAAERTLVETDSPYQHLFVTQDSTYRVLRTNSVMHTQMRLKDPQGRGFPYTDYVDIAFLFNPKIRNVLVVGLGGGSIPKRLVRDYPQVKVDVVEIDPTIVKLARQYFYVRPGPRLTIYQSDGRVFLRKSKKQYDLIMLDAYYADTVPFFLTTQEFFKIISDHLTPGGVFANNVIGVLAGPKSKFFRSVYRTTRAVFPQVHIFRVPEPGAPFINLELFALKSKLPVSIAELQRRSASADNAVKDKLLVKQLVNNYAGSLFPDRDVPLLTDDYAPVDALIHLW